MGSQKGIVRDLTSEGYGVIAPADGPVILLPYVIEGEEVSYVVERRKRQLGYGRLVEVHKPSPHRIMPTCSVFGQCGGCRWQMMSYAHQLHIKRRFVEAQLRHIAKLSVSVPAVQAAPSPWHYRNKVEYTFGWGPEGKVVVGFHRWGDFRRVIPIDRCQIVPPAFEAVRQRIEAQAQSLDFPPYDPHGHKGVWRELLIRGTPDKFIVMVSLAQDRADWAESLLAPLREFPGAQGIGYIYNPKRNNSLFDLTPHLLWGNLELTYEVGGRHFTIGPLDFFQVNLAQAEALVQWLRARVPQTPALYDLYGGVGFLGISVAERTEKIILIEKFLAAVQRAKENFLRNQQHYPNTHFEGIAGALEKVWAESSVPLDSVAIIDPPREGLHPSVVKLLQQAPFAHIFYVSCHPATQARDLAAIERAYEIREVQPFDMFPQTSAIENVVWLMRRP